MIYYRWLFSHKEGRERIQCVIKARTSLLGIVIVNGKTSRDNLCTSLPQINSFSTAELKPSCFKHKSNKFYVYEV